MVDLIDERAVRPVPADEGPLLRLMPQADIEEVPAVASDGEAVSEPWVVPERPPSKAGYPMAGSRPIASRTSARRCPTATGSIPSSSKRTNARQLLKSRLCTDDRGVVGERDVPGAALAERLYRHCSHENGFLTSGRLPLAESIFRCVLTADHGGLTDGALVEMLRDRSGAVPVSTTLLRRLRDTVRSYPIRRVDADLFGGRR